MRPKRPLVCLAKREQQGGAQLRDFMASRALRPKKARVFGVGTIADMLEGQRESIKSVDPLMKLLHCFPN